MSKSLFLTKEKQKVYRGAREVTQQLGVLAVIPEDTELFPSTHMGQATTRRFYTIFWTLGGSHTHVHIPAHIQTCTHKIIKAFLKQSIETSQKLPVRPYSLSLYLHKLSMLFGPVHSSVCSSHSSFPRIRLVQFTLSFIVIQEVTEVVLNSQKLPSFIFGLVFEIVLCHCGRD